MVSLADPTLISCDAVSAHQDVEMALRALQNIHLLRPHWCHMSHPLAAKCIRSALELCK